MKHYKDGCHHYKVIDKHRVITVTNLKGLTASISFDDYCDRGHYVLEDIESKKVKPCTQKEYQAAFDKALNTINNLK